MSDSKLKIREKEYNLPRVKLSLEFDGEEEQFLRFDLFADCENPAANGSGFAINCMSIEGLSSRNDIEDLVFELGENVDDPYNELGESVFVENGEVLELDYLYLEFGKIINDLVVIEMKAVCRSYEEDKILVAGKLMAEINER